MTAPTPPPPAPPRPVLRIPRGRVELYRQFGDPGTVAKPNAAWAKANIVERRDLPGVPTKWYVHVNRALEPVLRAALAAAATAAPTFAIDHFGCFVLRHQRHDPKRPLSIHSWGIAFDVNADQNDAATYRPGAKPAPWSAAWHKRWPHAGAVTEPFVLALEAAGFAWGGRWRGFVDPMHFEWYRTTTA